MKNLPLLLLFALLASCAREVSKDRLVERDGITYEVLSTEPYSGSVYTEYEKLGRVKNGEYVDGLKEGPWILYYENSQLDRKGSYKSGNRVGPWEFYLESGQLKIASSFNKDGEQEGLLELYYKNGQLEVRSFYKKGKENGPVEVYYENGQLHFKGSMKDGEFDGLVEYYNEAGVMITEVLFNDGERTSEEYSSTKDTGIRAAINARLKLDSSIDASRIQVFVSNSSVSLSGKVSSRADERKAKDIALDTRYVRDVKSKLVVEP